MKTIIMAAILMLSATSAAALEPSFEIETGMGVDENASRSANGDVARIYIPVAMEMGLEDRRSSRLRLRWRYQFGGDFYPSSTHDEQFHALRADQRWRARRRSGFRKWTFRLEERVRYQRKFFSPRGSEEEFEILVGSGAIGLGERFHNVEARLRSEYERHFRPTGQYFLGLDLARKDYIRDFESVPEVYALDHNAIDLRGGIRLELADYRGLEFEVGADFKFYDEKFARRLDGSDIPDQATRRGQFRAGAEYAAAPPAGLRWKLATEVFQRSDFDEGYWNAHGAEGEAALGWRQRRAWEIMGSARWRGWKFSNAHVQDDPALPLREKSLLDLGIQLNGPVGAGLEMGLDLQVYQYQNNDEAFAYDRNRWEMTLHREF